MSALCVGQRVRILWSEKWPELAGETGRIIGRSEDIANVELDPPGEWHVYVDCWGASTVNDDPEFELLYFTPISEQLEPITPTGHCAGDYSFKELMDLHRIKPRMRTRKPKPKPKQTEPLIAEEALETQ